MLNKGHGRKVTTSLDDSLLPVSNKAMTEALKAKLLWSGSFSSGSITVPNLSEYFVVAVACEDAVIAIGTPSTDETALFGGLSFVKYQGTSIVTFAFRYALSGNILSIDDYNKGFVNDVGTVINTKAIYGLIKK